MHLLIIDNETRRLAELRALCTDHTVEVVGAGKLEGVDPDGYDGIILSGSPTHAVVPEPEYYADEANLILATTKPVIGICLGFQLIADVYGCRLVRLPERITGAVTVMPTSAGRSLFPDGDAITAYAAHRWGITSVSDQLVALATSASGIEAIRHRTRPIYGVQFHPEVTQDSAEGAEVFHNILNRLTTKA